MRPLRFDFRDEGVRDLANGPKVAAYLQVTGAAVKRTIEGQAAGFARTRTFADSIETTDVERGMKGPRITIYSTDWAAHLIEFGSINNEAYAPFRRACASLGLALKGGGERR